MDNTQETENTNTAPVEETENTDTTTETTEDPRAEVEPNDKPKKTRTRGKSEGKSQREFGLSHRPNHSTPVKNAQKDAKKLAKNNDPKANLGSLSPSLGTPKDITGERLSN